MSSRILSRGEAVSVSPMVWAKADPDTRQQDGALSQSDSPQESFRLQGLLSGLQKRFDGETAAAYQKGVHDGETKERGHSAAEVQAAVDRLGRSLSEIVEYRPRLRHEAESDVVQLALAIAKRVLRREMSIDQTAMQGLVKVALEKLERQEILRIYVHPNQAAAVRQALETQGVRSVEVIPEMMREAGSLVFDTNRGKVDASVSAQLEEIERGLTDRVAAL